MLQRPLIWNLASNKEIVLKSLDRARKNVEGEIRPKQLSKGKRVKDGNVSAENIVRGKRNTTSSKKSKQSGSTKLGFQRGDEVSVGAEVF